MALLLPPIPSLVSFMPDVVAVYNQFFIQVFRNARPVKLNVRPAAKLMEHPLETGATIIDHRVIMPTEIEIDFILQAVDYFNTFQQIQQLFQSGTLLIVQTKSSVYSNQVIQELPHEETPDSYNTFPLKLRLIEALFAPQSVNITNPSSPSNTNTVDRGNVQPQSAAGQSVTVRNIFSNELQMVAGS